ncbi:MAG TPA: VOC family protein [Terriglobales bacterium]|jgi:methylmalonyl-CoA/ethylmalonyl-CoA epimerase
MSSSATAAVQINDIGQISVPVLDVARATAFYRDVVGLHHLFSAGNLSFFQAGSVRIMLSIPEGTNATIPGSILYYRTPNIQAAYDGLVQRGAKPESKPHLIARMPDHELWLTDFQDSEGNLFALMEERR